MGRLYRRRKNGPWYADYEDPNGVRWRFSTRVTDKKVAATILAQRERDDAAQAAAGLASDATGRTIEDLTWHLAVEAHTNTSGKPISAGTRKMYREKGGHLNRLLRVCGGCAVNGDLAAVEACEAKHGSIELTKLKRADVVRYIDHRIAEGAARTTIKKELNTLSVAFKHAGNRGWVPHSAAIECVPRFAAQSEPRTRWLTLEEFPKLLAALDTTAWMAKRVSRIKTDEAERRLREHREHVADRQLFVTVACFTGAELAALSRFDWADVYFAIDQVRVPGTKNATRDRTIDLDPQLKLALLRVPPERRHGPVLRPWVNACTDLRAACKRAGIDRVTPHTFRHTFGSWLVQAGVDTFVVGKLMGHKDSKMVERYYGHLAPKNKSEAMARLPRFPALFPSETSAAGTTEPCAAGVPNLVAIPGAYGVHCAPGALAAETQNPPVLEEKQAVSTTLRGEGRRTRTFNQRIKSTVAAGTQAFEVSAKIPIWRVNAATPVSRDGPAKDLGRPSPLASGRLGHGRAATSPPAAPRAR
jgi:integrase